MCAHFFSFFFYTECYSFVIPLGFQMEDIMSRRPHQSLKESHTRLSVFSTSLILLFSIAFCPAHRVYLQVVDHINVR